MCFISASHISKTHRTTISSTRPRLKTRRASRPSAFKMCDSIEGFVCRVPVLRVRRCGGRSGHLALPSLAPFRSFSSGESVYASMFQRSIRIPIIICVSYKVIGNMDFLYDREVSTHAGRNSNSPWRFASCRASPSEAIVIGIALFLATSVLYGDAALPCPRLLLRLVRDRVVPGSVAADRCGGRRLRVTRRVRGGLPTRPPAACGGDL